ncbi:hypothetical protein PHYBLDRAFT_175941 [Phycomyces blakesleeanus NRRL 1555(-)]|uniref:Secreted protein n=1 Tax=Phycomyces blakesleeanus (strain ATCC 8743b / DSM 1359 / FGSC 10004 / NBRC 33097 / NRRL 1555) TaxID=763407 RepID=A0A167JDC6_PHYB8|nr:hypothetical protein PHYBLDRAFT_175941 [Phycomyces blakesleeanus NRRL 1555(-)]OAD65768.1 hypothetical protein PHYBLDRAFT_175941 [Phycomyces blakesleeanus NRRL 1555(-)]|eukprot:XP_018283808.1 hypothetical protein PHYBLDRAFT_175941 [Phycomyces blakesleeanus NRRL 1555(-)]
MSRLFFQVILVCLLLQTRVYNISKQTYSPRKYQGFHFQLKKCKTKKCTEYMKPISCVAAGQIEQHEIATKVSPLAAGPSGAEAPGMTVESLTQVHWKNRPCRRVNSCRKLKPNDIF